MRIRTQGRPRKVRVSLLWTSVGVVVVLLTVLVVFSLWTATSVVAPPPSRATPSATASSTSVGLRLKSLACQRLRSVADIRSCIPAHFVRDLGPTCHDVTTWLDVQRCLNGRVGNNVTKKSFYEVHVIGERNSGTKWVARELQTCWPKKTSIARVHRDYYRAKHFFQPIMKGRPKNDVDSNNSTVGKIVITIVRDPVAWTAAMREKPYHASSHLAGFGADAARTPLPLPWHEFVTRPWTTHRSTIDLQLQRQLGPVAVRKYSDCMEQFMYSQVVPCQYDANVSTLVPPERIRGYEPIYELPLRRVGTTNVDTPYSSILELRRDKIANFVLHVALLHPINGFLVVRYEDLLRHGTRAMLEQVGAIMGVPCDCAGAASQPERLQGGRPVPSAFRQYVLEHMDRETEQLLGYAE